MSEASRCHAGAVVLQQPLPRTLPIDCRKSLCERTYRRARRSAGMEYAIGIDLGGSSVKAAAITRAGEVLERENQDFDADQQFDFAKKVKEIFFAIQKRQ